MKFPRSRSQLPKKSGRGSRLRPEFSRIPLRGVRRFDRGSPLVEIFQFFRARFDRAVTLSINVADGANRARRRKKSFYRDKNLGGFIAYNALVD
ncbi:MAG TPA: hypothetical protein VF278_04975 [Pirellulales bacterium]